MLAKLLDAYDKFLTSSAHFLSSLNNTFWGMSIMALTAYFYIRNNHDATLFFGGVATTLIGIKQAEPSKSSATINVDSGGVQNAEAKNS